MDLGRRENSCGARWTRGTRIDLQELHLQRCSWECRESQDRASCMVRVNLSLCDAFLVQFRD